MLSTTYPRLAFVDLETSGGIAAEDRVIEVGIIEVDEHGVREWSSLVNPGVRIPPFIQSLTGISNAMVAEAPDFGRLADEIHMRLDGRIFIAHNARFDHGFLRNEFRRTGHSFRPQVLCTVRLSRKLYPGFARHNLDAIVQRHRLEVSERHRALGDARLIWQFWQKIHETVEAEVIDTTVTKLLSRPSLPPQLDGLPVDVMPSGHGVYLFFGENDLPLYVGKANNLRRRVLSHFTGDHSSIREQQLTQQVRRLDWIETSGELGALLQEAALIKKLQPIHNRQLRSNQEVCSWRLVPRNGMLQPVLARTDDLFFAHDSTLYGLFSGSRKATEALRGVADAHGLCHVVLGLEKGGPGKACFASQLNKCGGACAGREPAAAHDARLLVALEKLRLQPWPFRGPIGLPEAGEVHVVDAWAYLGTAAPGAVESMLHKGQHRFDHDVYQIMQKWLPRMHDRLIEL